MPLSPTEASVINTAIGALPKVLALIRGEHKAVHPTDPLPTDAEVLAALQAWAVSTLAVDAAWKAAHPVTPTT